MEVEDILRGFPEQIEEAVGLVKDVRIKGAVSNILICAIGGSGIGGDLLKDYLKKELKIPIIVNRDYSIPEFVDKNTLVFVVSYSGNTKETLSAYKEAESKKAKIIAITSNGKLSKICRNYVLVPGGIPPRFALAYLFFPMLIVLQKLRLIKNKNKDIKKVITVLKKFRPIKAKNLARSLYKKIPVIYASENYRAVVYRWKTQFNEDSKCFAIANVIPELDHNEIEAELNKNFEIVLIRDMKDSPEIKKQTNATKSIIGPINEIYVEGKGLLAKMFYAIYLGDYVSCYLALLNKKDPMKIKKIDKLKRKLK